MFFFRSCAHPVDRCHSGPRIQLRQPLQDMADTRWCGAVARSTNSAICCAMVRATRRLVTSPPTIPLGPPSGWAKLRADPNEPCQPLIYHDPCQTGATPSIFPSKKSLSFVRSTCGSSSRKPQVAAEFVRVVQLERPHWNMMRKHIVLSLLFSVGQHQVLEVVNRSSRRNVFGRDRIWPNPPHLAICSTDFGQILGGKAAEGVGDRRVGGL